MRVTHSWRLSAPQSECASGLAPEIPARPDQSAHPHRQQRGRGSAIRGGGWGPGGVANKLREVALNAIKTRNNSDFFIMDYLVFLVN